MTKLAPEWVRTSDPVIRSPARYRWTTAPASAWCGKLVSSSHVHVQKTIYASYVRPILDYGCVIYNKCSRLLADRLESVQRNAALACTRAFRRTPTTALLAELGWPTLETRRQYFRLVMLYKMKNSNTPDYLQSILPPLQGQYANRPGRHAHTFTAPRTRGQKHHQSLVPPTIRQWNALDDDMRNLPSM